MEATANFGLRFDRVSESKVETTGWLLSRQTVQRVATRISLASEAIGFLVLGILIISEPASGRPEWFLRLVCDDRWHQRSFSGHDFPCYRLRPLEVLRQTSGHAAGQASFGPFHFC
jgi:hypothetical protein